MKSVVALAIGLMAVGCAKEKEEPKVDPPSSLFETADLEAGTVGQIPANEISGYVSGAAYALSEEQDVGVSLDDEEDAAGACMRAKLEALTFSSDKANAMIDSTVDIKDCKVLDEEDRAYQYDVAEVKVLAWFGCKNDDIEDLDGHAWSESKGSIPAFAYCKSEEDLQMMVNADFNLTATAENEGQKLTLSARRIMATQTKDGDPCAATYADANWTWTDGCTLFDRLYLKGDVDGQAVELGGESYLSAEYKSIVQSHDPHPFFESGQVALKIDNWTGTMTYAGGSSAPTWEMTDGSTTKQGSIMDFALTSGSFGAKVKKQIKNRL